jgi:hypothetical protein
VTEDAFIVPVTAPDLRVGDVIKWIDGRYYAVDSLPNAEDPQEYADPGTTVWVTELNDDMTRLTNSTKVLHSDEAVLNVLTPRPED